MRNYYPMFDLESFCIIRDMHKDSNFSDPNMEISIRPYIQRFALNTTLTLCYGIRMDDTYDELLREILHVGSAISLLRSASENLQDYVPALRYLPNNEKDARSKDLRSRRDAYLNLLLDKVREMIKNGTDKPCISAAILKDEETKLSGVEVSSICLSLVSGGFETIPGTLTSCLGSLCTPEGADISRTRVRRHQATLPGHSRRLAEQLPRGEGAIPQGHHSRSRSILHCQLYEPATPDCDRGELEWRSHPA